MTPQAIGDGKWHHVAGTFDGKRGAIKFAYESEMGRIKFDAKIKDDVMSGTLWLAEQGSRDFTASLWA